MPSNPKNTVSTVIPAMRYRDANAAIEWLCKAFGFERHLVVPGENGTVDHAQLTFGNGMIMLGLTHRPNSSSRAEPSMIIPLPKVSCA